MNDLKDLLNQIPVEEIDTKPKAAANGIDLTKLQQALDNIVVGETKLQNKDGKDIEFEPLVDGTYNGIIKLAQKKINAEKGSYTLTLGLEVTEGQHLGRLEFKNYIIYSPKLSELALRNIMINMKNDFAKFGLAKFDLLTIEADMQTYLVNKRVHFLIKTNVSNQDSTKSYRNVSIKPL